MDTQQPTDTHTWATRAHVAPFVAWLVLMYALPRLGVTSALGYALRTVVCLGLVCGLRPWRWHSRPQARHVPLGVLTGAAVLALWVLPETSWVGPFAGLQQFYLKYCLLPFGRVPDLLGPSPFAPANCGWTLTLVRLLGSAFVIALIEEFFWRGFLLRWFQDQAFLSVELGQVQLRWLLLVSLLFGLEHARWFAGILAGLAYGGLTLRTRSVWPAAVAHVVTNVGLGLYVIAGGHYAFW